METSCFETLNSCTTKLENDLETGFEKVKSTTNVLSKKLQLGLTLPENDRDMYGVIDTNNDVKNIHNNVERFCPKAETCFSYLQVISACIDSFGHGANDVANAIDPFAAMLAIYLNDSVSKKQIHNLVLAMGGLKLVWHRMVNTLFVSIGVKIGSDYTISWFYAEISSSIVVILAARLGIPTQLTVK